MKALLTLWLGFGFLWHLVCPLRAAAQPEVQFPALIVLGQNKELHFTSRQPEGVVVHHYTHGDTVWVDYVAGVLRINGVPYRPQAPLGPISHPIDYVKEHYGQVPLIRSRVGLDTLSVEKWNEALRYWRDAYHDLYAPISQDYLAAIGRGSPEDSACQIAIRRLKASELVDSVSEGPPALDRHRTLYVNLVGQRHEQPLIFAPPPPYRGKRITDSASEEDAVALVKLLRQHLVVGEDRVILNLRFGTTHFSAVKVSDATRMHTVPTRGSFGPCRRSERSELQRVVIGRDGILPNPVRHAVRRLRPQHPPGATDRRGTTS